MDSGMRQSLDNYITGGRYHSWREELICKKCNHRWEADMFEEYGMVSFKDDDDSICPECDSEVEE